MSTGKGVCLDGRENSLRAGEGDGEGLPASGYNVQNHYTKMAPQKHCTLLWINKSEFAYCCISSATVRKQRTCPTCCFYPRCICRKVGSSANRVALWWASKFLQPALRAIVPCPRPVTKQTSMKMPWLWSLILSHIYSCLSFFEDMLLPSSIQECQSDEAAKVRHEPTIDLTPSPSQSKGVQAVSSQHHKQPRLRTPPIPQRR